MKKIKRARKDWRKIYCLDIFQKHFLEGEGKHSIVKNDWLNDYSCNHVVSEFSQIYLQNY